MKTLIAYHNDGSIEYTIDLDEKNALVYDGDVDFKTQYVKNGQVLNRPSVSYSISSNEVPADGQSAIRFTGLSNTSRITVNENTFGPDNGEISLTFSVPGEYTAIIEDEFPGLQAEEIIHAK